MLVSKKTLASPFGTGGTWESEAVAVGTPVRIPNRLGNCIDRVPNSATGQAMEGDIDERE